MNLIDLVKGQITPDMFGKLAGQIGASEAQTKNAVGAAIPALLSGLAGSASEPGGAQKMISALGGLGSMGDILSGGALEKGSGMLGTLLGGGTLGTIVTVLSKFSGLGGDAIKKLLGFLMPMVMGAVMNSFKGKMPDAAGLTSLFAEQKNAIAGALPAGLSLPGLPGMGNVAASARAAAGQAMGAAQDAGSGFTKLLISVLALAALAYGGWWFINRGPAVPAVSPEVQTLTKDVGTWFTTTTESLTSIKDAASADAALPKLNDAVSKLDMVKATFDKLPDLGKSSIKSLIGSKLAALKELIAKVTALPGVGDKIKPVTDKILATLNMLGA